MAESFSTPDHPEDIIIECEGCGNYLYTRKKEEEKVLACPLCGCLNTCELDDLFVNEKAEEIRGHLILKSPKMSMNRESVEGGRVTLPELPDKVQESLLWLQKNRWKFGFVVEGKDKEDKDEEGE